MCRSVWQTSHSILLLPSSNVFLVERKIGNLWMALAAQNALNSPQRRCDYIRQSSNTRGVNCKVCWTSGDFRQQTSTVTFICLITIPCCVVTILQHNLSVVAKWDGDKHCTSLYPDSGIWNYFAMYLYYKWHLVMQENQSSCTFGSSTTWTEVLAPQV